MVEVSDYARQLLSKNYRQTLRITYQDKTTGEEKHITEQDVVQGGFSIDRYCTTGSTIEIGSAIAAEMSLELDNRDGRFDDVNFEGVEMFVEIGVEKWDAYNWEKAQMEYIPCGYFTVDKPPRKLSTISLTGLDRMVKLDKPIAADFFGANGSGGLSAAYYLMRVCLDCGVSLGVDANLLTNATYKVYPSFGDDEDVTYRMVVQWIAQITGTCAYIDWEGKLRLEWYGDAMPENHAVKIGLSDRYTSTLQESLITITGIEIDYGAETTIQAGNSDKYQILVEGNGLLSDGVDAVAANIWNKMNDFTYLPYECDTNPLPYLWPLDLVSVEDKNGNWYDSIVTHVHFGINGHTTVKAVGETSTEQSYARSSPVTTSQAVSDKRKEKISASLNEMIVNSLGLYYDKQVLPNGSYQIYAYDKQTAGATLEDNLRQSTIVYVSNAGGVAWTDNWDGENTIWKYGVDRAGNAVLNTIIANKISADWFEAKKLSSENGSTEINLEDGTFSFGDGKFAMGVDGIVKLIGKIQSTDGKFSATIGDSERGDGKAFTATDESVGDAFQVYVVASANGGQVIWTAPFANGDNGSTRKGVYINRSEIGLFADGSNCGLKLDQEKNETTVYGEKVTIDGTLMVNKVNLISYCESMFQSIWSEINAIKEKVY